MYEFEALNEKTSAEEAFLSLLMEGRGEGQIYTGEPVFADYNSPEIAEYFCACQNRLIFEAMLNVYALGRPLDMLNIFEELKKTQNLDKAGGIAHLSYLASLEIHRASRAAQLACAEDRFDHLKRSFLKRRSVRLCLDIGNMAKSNDNAEQVLGYVSNELQQIQDLRDKLTPKTKYNMFDTWLCETEAIMSRSNEVLVPTGFQILDNQYFHGGMERGNLIIVAGRTSMGKTTFCTNVAANVAKRGGSVLYFSLEMTQKQLLDRVVAREINLPVKYCFNPNLTSPQDQNRIFEAGQDICNNWKFYVNDVAGLSVSQIVDFARQYRRHIGSLDLVVIDHLLLLADSARKKAQTTAEIVNQNTLEIKEFAKNMHVPVLTVSQLNRSVETRQNKKPMLSDLKNSGGTEENADVVILAYREDYYDTTVDNKDILEINVAKNRSGGSTGTVLFHFDKSCQKLVEDPISVYGTPIKDSHATGIPELDIPNGLDDFNNNKILDIL